MSKKSVQGAKNTAVAGVPCASVCAPAAAEARALVDVLSSAVLFTAQHVAECALTDLRASRTQLLDTRTGKKVTPTFLHHLHAPRLLPSDATHTRAEEGE